MQWLSKRPLPLNSLRFADTALELTFRYWSGLRRDGRLPSRVALDTPKFRLLLPRVDWITIASGPFMREVDLGQLTSLAEARAAAGRAVDDLGRLLAEDVRTTSLSGSPIFQELVVEAHGQVDSWRHLILPTASDGHRVDALLQVASLRVDVSARSGRLIA